MNDAALSRRLAAEAVGTAMLLATVVGSGIMAERLAGGNAAIALLGNTLATGAALMVLNLVFGPVSGAHFNPAVTLVFAMRREIAASRAALYMLVQTAGAVAGVALAHAMFDKSLLEIGVKPRTGWSQWLAEAVATAGLIATILGTLKARADAVPFTVGLYIMAAYWFTASTSFANPAVTLARGLTDSFAGIALHHVPGFAIAQFAAAIPAALFFGWLFDHRAPR